MARSRTILLGILVLMVICLALALLGYLLYGVQRRRAMQERPLVLIHAPLNRERIPLGEGTSPHATARARGGVSRIELWVDGALLATRESSGEGPVSPLVLVSGWEPNILGTHVLVVRAFSSSGVAGQATITVEVVEAKEEEPALDGYVVAEGETLETIAEEVGADVEELEALNPDLGGDEPQPGDLLIVPAQDDASGGEGPGEEPLADDGPEGEGPVEPPPGDEAPPDPHDGAPGSLIEVIEVVGLEGFIPADEEPVVLRVEALALETDGAYESVHCYVGLAGIDPRWYPDVDGDQSTDDSFDSLGDTSWDVAAHLSGYAIPLISWPGDQPLPIDVTCVGMSGGGADAVDLGRLEIAAGPEAWDGITRPATSAEVSFTLDYRVSQEEPLTAEPQPWIDETMTPPTRLRLYVARGERRLHWEYEPRDDERLLDGGFRIYLNDTLQWVEPPGARFTALPDQWVVPPCGDEYVFEVSAFYDERCPDCRESDPSEPPVTLSTGEIGDPGCGRTVLVTFETLTTGNLGGDGDRDPGDMGPVYGSFYANDQAVGFNTRCDANLCLRFEGLLHNWEYTINPTDETSGIARQGPAHFQVEVPQGEYLEVGFDIWDEDTGRCRDSDDPGCDDPVCSGEDIIVEVGVPSSGVIDTEGPSGTDDDRCRVTYRVEPIGGPAVARGDAPALPLLRVEQLSWDLDWNILYILVRNVGSADWTGHDLTAAVERRSGAPIGVYTWPDLDIPAGETWILSQVQLVPERPMDACVTLDPGNEVRQLLDRSTDTGTIERPVERFCPPLPDLIIADVGYGEQSDVLVITVENVGEADLDHRQMGLRIDLPDGSHLSAPAEWWGDVSIDRGRQKQMHWSDFQHLEMLRDGFTAVVDADDDIAEEDEENNTYENAFVRMRVEFTELNADWTSNMGWADRNDEIYYHLSVGYGPSEEETIWVGIRVRYPESGNLHVSNQNETHSWRLEGQERYTFEFNMPADENVYVMVSGTEERIGGDFGFGPYEAGWGPDVNYGDSGDEHVVPHSRAILMARVRITRLD